MRRGLSTLLVLLAVSTSLAGLHPPGEELRLTRSRRGLPVVVVRAGAETLRLGLDTGTSRTLVSASAASRLGLAPHERFTVGDAAAQPRVGLCGRAPALSVGGLTLLPDCLGWLPDEKLVAGAEDLDGLLGADLLAEVDHWIDLRSTPVRARFAARGSLAPWIDGKRLSLESIGRRPVITGRLAGLRRDGSDVRLVVDSGANSVVLFGNAAKRAGAMFPHERLVGRLETATTHRLVPTIRLTGVRSEGSLFEVPWAALVPHVVDRVEDGLLPLGTLGPVLLDLSNGVIIVNARMRSAPR